jgi:hypothetical protein
MRVYRTKYGTIRYWFEDEDTIGLFSVYSPQRQGKKLMLCFERYVGKNFPNVKLLMLGADSNYGGVPLDSLIKFYKSVGFYIESLSSDPYFQAMYKDL